jgi:hypothetical protein
MKDKAYHFQLLNGRSVAVDQDCTFEEIRRMGDTMATNQRCRLKVQVFNGATNKWDYLGIFMGNRQFQNWDGDRWQINSDYKGMTRMTACARKEVAV